MYWWFRVCVLESSFFSSKESNRKSKLFFFPKKLYSTARIAECDPCVQAISSLFEVMLSTCNVRTFFSEFVEKFFFCLKKTTNIISIEKMYFFKKFYHLWFRIVCVYRSLPSFPFIPKRRPKSELIVHCSNKTVLKVKFNCFLPVKSWNISL